MIFGSIIVSNVLVRHFQRFRQRLSISVLLGTILAFSACKTTKKVVDIPPAQVKLKGASVIEVFDSLVAHQFNFEYLSAKANVDFTDQSGETQSFDVNLRIRKDSAIWISITPLLGIEAVRVLMNKDSLMVLDRVHKTILSRDFLYLESMLKTRVNYDMIQAMLIGNYFPYTRNEKIKSLYDDEPYMILSTLSKRQVKRIQEEKDPTKPVIQDFWVDGNYRIARARVTDDKLDRWVEATYKNFTQVGSGLFPNEMILTVFASTPTIMKIIYNKVELAESFTMPFSIPEKYTRK